MRFTSLISISSYRLRCPLSSFPVTCRTSITNAHFATVDLELARNNGHSRSWGKLKIMVAVDFGMYLLEISLRAQADMREMHHLFFCGLCIERKSQ
jgi:hypothetical protein